MVYRDGVFNWDSDVGGNISFGKLRVVDQTDVLSNDAFTPVQIGVHQGVGCSRPVQLLGSTTGVVEGLVGINDVRIPQKAQQNHPAHFFRCFLGNQSKMGGVVNGNLQVLVELGGNTDGYFRTALQ